MRTIACAFSIASLLIPVCIFAADFTGSVIDGDTIEVLNGHHTERIRLSGIDSPEKGQAYGQLVKQAASVLVYSKTVTHLTHSLDKYESAIADVLLPDGTNAIHALVKDGWYCWCRKYAQNLKLQG